MCEVEISPAADEALATELAQLINEAYALAEADLWRRRVTRTSAAEMAERIRAGETLVATSDGRILGCASVRAVDEGTSELGLVSTRPDSWGKGVGGELVRAAEALGRERGSAAMQLKVIVPIAGGHPGKSRLADWYGRLGYELVDSLPFEDVLPHAARDLAIPCKVQILSKPLA